MITNPRLWTVGAALAAALTLVACDKGSKPMASDAAADRTVAKSDNSMSNSSLGAKIDDAAITASVKTQIAKDSDLSALNVNVDTNNGQVTLHGSAPTPAAKDKATTLASAVKGVSGVDNQLTVGAGK
jgi:hyperosmotically inducible protein